MKKGDKVLLLSYEHRQLAKPIQTTITKVDVRKKSTWITTAYDTSWSFPISNNWVVLI